MKTLLSAVLMIAVSAWGQHPEYKCMGDHCESSINYCRAGFHATNITRVGSDYTFNCEQVAPKPHKPKPPVKKETITQNAIACVADGVGCWTGPVPDKAAVPVDEECWKDKNCNLTVTAPSISMVSTDGSRVALLSDSEYSHLQQLRASVVEEEKRLAVKYGANGANFVSCSGDIPAMKIVGCFSDYYEFHGQFLLITKEGR